MTERDKRNTYVEDEDDTYIVTDEDLDVPPMSTLQKVFIVLAVLIVVAAVVYMIVR